MPAQTLYQRMTPATWPPLRKLVCVSVRPAAHSESQWFPADLVSVQVLEAALYKALDGSPYWIVGRGASRLGPRLDDRWIEAWWLAAEEQIGLQTIPNAHPTAYH